MSSNWEQINLAYYIAGSVLTALLIFSEVLGWVKTCRANSITQLYLCIDCINRHDPRRQVDLETVSMTETLP
jgi:hypothetical protein